MLIWKHSRYYNSPSRLVVLMREICNDLIEQARREKGVNRGRCEERVCRERCE